MRSNALRAGDGSGSGVGGKMHAPELELKSRDAYRPIEPPRKERGVAVLERERRGIGQERHPVRAGQISASLDCIVRACRARYRKLQLLTAIHNGRAECG